MSTTSNAQDLLVNVFRPTYRWDSNTGFVPSMVVSNVSELITGRINTDRLDVADSNGNSYIGCNAGPALANLTTYSNTAIGVAAMAGASNSSNNVSIGASNFSGLSNGMCNVGIGAKTIITGAGQENILIGTNITMGDGSGNIIIGNDLSLGNISKTFRLGSLLYGDLSSGFVGINTSKPEAALDISGIVVFRNKVGFQNPEPTYSLDVAGSVFASEQIIGSNGTFTNPLFTFKDASGTGMYVPASGAGFGDGAFGIAVNRSPAAVFSSNQVNFYQNLDVSGTFSARSVVLDGFEVQDGTAADPTMTFENDTASGLYLVGTSRVGVTTAGLRRMEILPTGDVSMARLVTRDISYSGTIVGTDPTTCNVIGGVTLCNGNVILTGTATNSNLLVPGWIRNTDPATQLDISGGNISNSLTTRSSNFRASAGTAGVPAYSFASDPSTGLHWTGTSQLAFDTSGIQRMCISGGFVGIGTPTPRVALDVSGDISANVYNGPGGTQGAPHYTFSDDRTTGVFFPGANIVGLTAGGTERMRISNSNVGIGTTDPTNALDVSGTLRVIGTAGDLTFSNGSIRLGGATLISSTGVLSNANATSNIIGGVTLNTTDISMTTGGRILGVAATSNTIGGVTLSNTVVRVGNGTDTVPTIAFSSETNTGLYRFTPGGIGVVSGGNTVARLTTASSFFFTDSLIALTLSNRQLLAQNGTAAAPSHSFVGQPDMGLFAAGDRLGVSIGGVVRSTFSNGDFSNSGTITTSNLLASGYLRNALTPSTYDISGGNISNSATTRSSNFLAAPGGAPRPAYAFTTDPSSGLDLVGTSYLAFDTSGVQRMCISGDLVGIGTAAPSAWLDVSGRARIVQDGSTSLTSWGLNNQADTLILQHTGSYSTAADRGKSASILFANATSNYPQARIASEMLGVTAGSYGASLLFQTNSQGSGLAERMRVHSNGFVGIGMSAPVSALDVSSPSDGDGKAVIQVKNSSTGQGIVRVIGSNQANTTGLELFHTGSYGGLYLPAGISNLSFWTAGARQMDLVNGRIGVGNATPTATLDLAAAGAWIAVNRNGNIPFVSDVSMIVEGGNGVGLYFQKGTNNNFCGISIKTLCNNTLAERFRVDANTGYVGIGTTAPAYPLDISTAGNTVPLALRAAGLTGGGQNLIELYANSSAAIPARRVGLGLTASTGTGNDGNDFSINSYTDAGGYLSTPVIVKRNTGRVGISQTIPGYRLDVTSEATTAAAINASTWSRSAISTTHYAVWGGQASGGGITWTTCNAMSSDIMTIGDDNGTYFVPKVSGIYSFSIWLGGTTAGDPATYLDVSTNISHNVLNPGLCPQLAMNQTVSGSGRASLFFTGFLPSNSTHYYKTKMVSLGSIATGPSGGKLYVCFLGEVGVGSSRPW
jgi:hypothetical protein